RRSMKCAKHAKETSSGAEPIHAFSKPHWLPPKDLGYEISKPPKHLGYEISKPPKDPGYEISSLRSLRRRVMPQQPQASPSPKPKKKIRVPRVVNGIEQMVEIEVDADSGPGWGPNDKHTLLNKRMTRVDGPVKATGVARYTYDQRLPGMLYGRILRCPHGHARVTNLDTDAAAKIPGVKAIVPAPLTELRYAGAPVAAVAAVTPEIAGDALRAIKVTYEVLPHVVHADAAMKPDSPKVVAEENNVQEKAKNGDP